MAKPNLTLSLPSVERAHTHLHLRKLAALVALVALLVFIFLVGARLVPVPSESALVVERIALPTRERMVAQVRNASRAPLTIAQVQVDSAYWRFTIEPGPTLVPGATATVAVPYLWVQNERHTMTFVTSTGATFSGQIASATLDPVTAWWTQWFLLAGGVGVLALGGWLIAPWLGRVWAAGLPSQTRSQVGLALSLLAGTLLVGVGGLMSLLVR